MKKLLFALLLFISVLAVNAQDNPRGPHGAKLKTVGDYKIEAFGCDEYLEIYLFNQYTEPILNYGISGMVKFYKQDQVYTAVSLVYYGNDGFTAKFPDDDFFYYTVTLEVNGKAISAKFQNECSMPLSK